MENKTKKYLKILSIELEDLITDLEFTEKIVEKRFKEHEITEYVFRENISLIKREILGIEKLERFLKKSLKKFGTMSELRDVVENYFKDEIALAGLPNAVFLLVSRKLEKIDQYMNLGE